MIGVLAPLAAKVVVAEFFELFKTPWEVYRSGHRYDVVLCDGASGIENITASLVLVYAGGKTDCDTGLDIEIESRCDGAELSLFGKSLPIYGNALTFRQGSPVLKEEASGRPVVCAGRFGEKAFARIGYDLFREIETLLVTGQPFKNAPVPTLDLHIQLLRHLITSNGIPLVEIPPVPDGYSFITCLTHDLDHACIRRHRFDPTIFGFLYRATVDSAIKAVRGRLSLGKLLTNWAAAAKLPLIYLGLEKDIWYEFDRYVELEKGRHSTFFVIPFENRPGRSANGTAPRARGTRYDVSHIASKIPRLRAAGCEIALHGIDAWADSSKAREEAGRISATSGTDTSGVRMHWLYSDAGSAKVLEDAGFSYDSTVGYNNTVGYRAGTVQVFKPLNAARLLELPMHVMDTALFYPSYLNLSDTQAWQRLSPMFDNAMHYGGILTINWHDRSIAPERLWGSFYVRVLDELSARGAWFPTALQAVSWFRKRRSAVFEEIHSADARLRVSFASENAGALPGFRLRYHPPQRLSAAGTADTAGQDAYTDTAFDGSLDIPLPNKTNRKGPEV